MRLKNWHVRSLLVAIVVLGGWSGFSGPALLCGALLFGLLLSPLRRPFAEAFLLAFGVWCAVALIQDIGAEFRLSQRISQVFHLPISGLAYIVTGSVAGLFAGTSAVVGQRIRLWWNRARGDLSIWG